MSFPKVALSQQYFPTPQYISVSIKRTSDIRCHLDQEILRHHHRLRTPLTQHPSPKSEKKELREIEATGGLKLVLHAIFFKLLLSRVLLLSMAMIMPAL